MMITAKIAVNFCILFYMIQKSHWTMNIQFYCLMAEICWPSSFPRLYSYLDFRNQSAWIVNDRHFDSLGYWKNNKTQISQTEHK